MAAPPAPLPAFIMNGPLPPLVYNTTSLPAAVSHGTLGIGHSAGGYMISYFIGVSKMLHQLGIIKPGATRTAGSSSGALAQLVDHPYGPTHARMLNGTVDFVQYCRDTHRCTDHLDEAFERLFVKLVDPNQPFDPSYDKRCTVYAKHVGFRNNTGTYSCKERSVNETVELLRTMVYVPGWSSPTEKFRRFNGSLAYDGAFVQPLPCPPNVTYCVKVLGVVPVEPAVYMKAFREHPQFFRSTWGTMSEFASEARHSDVRSVGLVQFQDWFKLFGASRSKTVDIFPGKFSRSPISPLETIYAIFTPPKPQTVLDLYAAGYRDAYAFAREKGWPVPPPASVGVNASELFAQPAAAAAAAA